MNKNKEQELNRINYICPKWTKKGFASLLLDSCQICAGHRFFFGRPMGPRVGRVAPLRSHKLGGVNTQHPSFNKKCHMKLYNLLLMECHKLKITASKGVLFWLCMERAESLSSRRASLSPSHSSECHKPGRSFPCSHLGNTNPPC